jgi:broad specificity phosphatase PhoE
MATQKNILVLIRHGEAIAHGEGLSDLGIIQTNEAATFVKQFFGKIKIAHLICSDGPCAKEGAHIIGKEINEIPLVLRDQETIGLIESSIDKFPGELPKVVITRGKFIRESVPLIAANLKCKNPLEDDELPDKGRAYAVICDFDKKTIERVAF